MTDQGARRLSWGGAAGLALALMALRPGMTVGQQKMSPAESAQAVAALTTWFECEECESGELARVQKYGAAVVPSLSAVLDRGLSPAKREQLKVQLEARHDTLTKRADKNPKLNPRMSKERFTAHYVENFDAQYRIRAAQALASIGGAQARSALEVAGRKRNRKDVQEVITSSLRTVR
jgi:hypothetical protein